AKGTGGSPEERARLLEILDQTENLVGASGYRIMWGVIEAVGYGLWTRDREMLQRAAQALRPIVARQGPAPRAWREIHLIAAEAMLAWTGDPPDPGPLRDAAERVRPSVAVSALLEPYRVEAGLSAPAPVEGLAAG